MKTKPKHKTALTPRVEVLPAFHEEVEKLRELHVLAMARVRDVVKLAIQSGEILKNVQDKFPKTNKPGQGFYDWVNNNLGYSKTTAFNYIRAYKRRNELLGSDGTSTVKTIRALTGSEYKDTKEAREANSTKQRTDTEPKPMLFPEEEFANLTKRKREELHTEAKELSEAYGGDERALRIAERYVWERHLKKRRTTAPAKPRRKRTTLTEEEEGTLNDLVALGVFDTFHEASEAWKEARTKRALKSFREKFLPK